MRIGLDLNNRAEGDAVARSMENQVIKLATVISGMLLELPSVAQRRAVISVVATLMNFNGTAPDISELRLHDGHDPEE